MGLPWPLGLSLTKAPRKDSVTPVTIVDPFYRDCVSTSFTAKAPRTLAKSQSTKRVALGELFRSEAMRSAKRMSSAQTGMLTTAKVRPRKRSFFPAWASWASMNWGER